MILSMLLRWGEGRGCVNTNKKRAARAVMQPTQPDPTPDKDDISSVELSEGEYLPSSNLASSSNDSREMAPKRRREEGDAFVKDLQKMGEGAEEDLTDNEESELPDWRENRYENKRSWLKEITASRGQPEARPSILYQPDEESNQFKCYKLFPLL